MVKKEHKGTPGLAVAEASEYRRTCYGGSPWTLEP